MNQKERNKGRDVYFQGSRQMTSTSRRYYEMELGAGVGPSPGFNEQFGYTEPLRRFIQREGFEPQANEIPNTMPSWMPGDDYYTNFRVGDPYVKVDQGFARLPGAGYEAIHPELKDVSPEDYPDINKLAILADVAPYSRQYNTRSLRPAPQQKPRACAGEAEPMLPRACSQRSLCCGFSRSCACRLPSGHWLSSCWADLREVPCSCTMITSSDRSPRPAPQQNPRARAGETPLSGAPSCCGHPALVP
jgi:hypothetical protein